MEVQADQQKWPSVTEDVAIVMMFVTGDATSNIVTPVTASSLRRATTDEMPKYSSVSQQGRNQASSYSSRRPLASQNGSQLLPVRQLAQHGINPLTLNNFCRVSVYFMLMGKSLNVLDFLIQGSLLFRLCFLCVGFSCVVLDLVCSDYFAK